MIQYSLNAAAARLKNAAVLLVNVVPTRPFRALRFAGPSLFLILFFVSGCNAPAGAPNDLSPTVASPSPTVGQSVPTTASSTRTPSAGAPTPAVAFSAASDWTTYHRDNTRTGYVANMPDPKGLALAWNTDLDGSVYGEPLVISGHVIAATEGDSVYSLNAQTGQVEWKTNLGQPVSRAQLPCGNINPLGITSTPVYDPASGLVFVVAEISGPAHILVGLEARTGTVRTRRSADPQGMAPLAHQQRAALALANGMIYVSYGGLYGDCGDYHGWVVASRIGGTGPLLVYQVPTGREGAIWAAAGPTIDATGRVFVSTGNGSEVVGDWDHSDSVLRLSATLQLEDGFAPDQWRQDNLTDADLGSLAPVLLGDGSIFIAGKAGIGYLLDSNALGGVGGQKQVRPVCHAYGGAAIVGSTIFVPCNEGVQEIRIGPGADFALGWRADGVPGSPVVGGNTVYSLDRGGTLHALDIQSGKNRATVSVGSTTRFATPTLYGNRVFVGTTTGITAVNLSQ